MKTEAFRPGEFVLSEGNGQISRENITIAAGAALEAGTILAKLTATGHYVAFDPVAAEPATGSEIAAGVLYARADATTAAVKAVGIVRHAEVKRSALTGLAGDAEDDLAQLDIYVRD
ncbi:MAG: head decoration protein [Thiomicrospira sp.]|jgi:hypothetical protein|nr:head decoration protein [Thiomicrospira sp.]